MSRNDHNTPVVKRPTNHAEMLDAIARARALRAATLGRLFRRVLPSLGEGARRPIRTPGTVLGAARG